MLTIQESKKIDKKIRVKYTHLRPGQKPIEYTEDEAKVFKEK